MLGVCILSVRLTWLRFFCAFSSVVRQMPGYNHRDGAQPTVFQNFCAVLCIVCIVSFCVLFWGKYVLYYCHQVATQLQLTNIPYHIYLIWDSFHNTSPQKWGGGGSFIIMYKIKNVLYRYINENWILWRGVNLYAVLCYTWINGPVAWKAKFTGGKVLHFS